ncbi:MAG: adenylyl-sulfate kinase, partial [Clostridiales bacterium]|nr:adenylyl-sulfate kinase [Clostridiales bacterium]
FDEIKEKYTAFLNKIGLESMIYIPVSATEGKNIASLATEEMPWYDGATVLDQLDLFNNIPPAEDLPFRLPIQDVYKFTEQGDNRRIMAGTIESGKFSVGDKLVFYPSGKKTEVKSLEAFNAPVKTSAQAGEAVGFTMKEQIYIRRGEVVCREGDTPPCVGVRLRTNLFWLGRDNLRTDKVYYLKCGTAKVEMTLEHVERVVNASDLSCINRQYVERNEVAECILQLDAPIAFDLIDTVAAMGRFVIVDDYEVAGGGIITEALPAGDFDHRNIRWSGRNISAGERKQILGHNGLIVWMTGLSGSGKTTIAEGVEKQLVSMGISAFILDGDNLRRGLNEDLGFSAEDRRENIRRAAHVASLFKTAGMVTIVTLISPYEESRRFARKVAKGDFMEVYVKADLETCKRRDPKNLYKKVEEGAITSFTGIDSPYEPPTAPDAVLDTVLWSEEECIETLVNNILGRIGVSR